MNFETYNPEDEKAQQIPRGDSRTVGQLVGNVVVGISEYSAHENSGNTAAIVRLGGEVDDGNDSPDQYVQARTSDTCRSANIDRKAYEVFDRAATVQHNHDG